MADGLDRLADDFDRAGDELHGYADKLVRGSTLRAEALGKANTPVRTGFLRSSFTTEFDSGPNRVSGETGPEASYSHFVHNGTSRQAPNPFLDRAADVVEPQFYAAADAIAAKLGIGRG